MGLIGLPDDLGVALNGGRVGARHGPAAFRDALARYGAAEPDGWNWPCVFDAGDVDPVPWDGSAGGDSSAAREALEQTHSRVTQAVQALVGLGLLPVGIGGGHDLTFAFVRGVDQARCVGRRGRKGSSPGGGPGGGLVGMYCDAHLDVRAEAGSGMAFRALVERCGVRALHVHGLNPMVNSAAHLEWFRAHGGTCDAFGPEGPWPEGELFVSLDLDVVDQAFAPGVSAPNPQGWTPGEATAWARAAGANPGVVCFDIMELNPLVDEGGRTARLAAHVFLAFLRGVSERPR